MSATGASVGDCPHCRVTIPSSRVLIEYETATGRGVYAECPACRDVVTPS